MCGDALSSRGGGGGGGRIRMGGTVEDGDKENGCEA